MGRIFALLGLLSATVATITGCGGSSYTGSAGQAGSSNEGQAGVGGAPPVPAVGECLTVLHLEGTSADSLLESPPTRLQDGFVFLEGNTPALTYLVATVSNEWQEHEISAGYGPYLRPAAAGTAQAPQLLLFDRLLGQGFEAQLLAQAVRPDNSTIAPLAPVLSVFDRGTAAYPTATALDGERVAIGNGHIATRDPHFVLLDKDAQVISDDIRLFDSGDHPSFDCFALTGTAHGVLASVVDRNTQEIHLLELDASGARVSEATEPVSVGGNCPTITVDPTGNYFSFEPDDGATAVFRFAGDAFAQVATLPAAPEHISYRWVGGAEQPLVAVFDSSGESNSISFARLSGESLHPLAGDTFTGGLVPSADGRVFLVSNASNVLGAGPDYSIIEVACGAASD